MISKLIIKESKNYLFINKPSGIHSTRLPEGGGESLADLLLKNNPEAESISEKPEDAGLIQRLDFETSGVIVAAKNREAWLKGREILNDEELKKSYLILVEGIFPKKEFAETYLGTPNRGAKKIKIYKSKPAKSARALLGRTEFELVTPLPDKNASLVRATCHRAHRHQVRAHAAFLGFPLLGDVLYGSSKELKEVEVTEQRQFFLHAERVAFNDPITGESYDVVANASLNL